MMLRGILTDEELLKLINRFHTDLSIELSENEKEKVGKKENDKENKEKEKREEENPFVKGFTTIPLLLDKYDYLKMNLVYKSIRERNNNGLEGLVVKVGKKCFVKEREFLEWYEESYPHKCPRGKCGRLSRKENRCSCP
jgi:hypothetical protein